jgi:preprotein translocase subunit YajC
LRAPCKPAISPPLGGALDFAVFAFQAVPPAAGRQDTPTPAPAPAPGQAEKAPPGGGPEGPPPGGGAFSLMFPLLLVGMLVFIFWSSRSQQKKQEQAVAGLKKGDRVLTQSGLVGRLVETDARYAKLEIAPGVKVQVLKSSVTGRDADETPQKKEKGEPAASEKKT